MLMIKPFMSTPFVEVGVVADDIYNLCDLVEEAVNKMKKSYL